MIPADNEHAFKAFVLAYCKGYARCMATLLPMTDEQLEKLEINITRFLQNYLIENGVEVSMPEAQEYMTYETNLVKALLKAFPLRG